MRTPLESLRHHAASAGDAIIDSTGARCSYADLERRARRIAASLADGGLVRRGERVALYLPPGADFVAAFFGVLQAGGCAVVLSPLYPPAELAYFVEDAEVRTILAEPHADKAHALGRRVLAPAVLAARSDPGTAPVEVTADDDAVQLYTSGTTGRPKGAVLRHGHLGTQQALLGDAWGLTPRDVLLHALPLHHLHGLGISLLAALGAGAAVRMLPAFDAVTVWENLAAASVWMAVPTMYQRLLAAHDEAAPEVRERWSASARGLRLATSGSAGLPVTLAARWQAIAGRIPVERFGMTEVGVAASNPVDGERRAGSVGRPLPTVSTRLCDEAGHDSGDEGELWVAGPSVFAGYWKRPAADAQAFVDDGGTRWFKTGDRARRLADGYLRLLGRTSVDILKSGGYKLSAIEIEEALREHPAVAEVAVVGVPDDAWGERVVACVVARAGRAEECAEDALREFVRARLAVYKVPKSVVIVAELPRNALGKVQKHELLARLTRAVP